jgi:hypothetical protein
VGKSQTLSHTFESMMGIQALAWANILPDLKENSHFLGDFEREASDCTE